MTAIATESPASPRIVMLGTGDFALPSFEHLVAEGFDVAALITQPDRPQGRKQELIASLIHRAADRLAVPVHQPESINAPEGVALVRSLRPDLLVTAAYGQILSAEVLAIPRLGGINLHGSVLPAYRGAAPVARAIQRGETESGVTVIRMTPRIDAGGMIAVAKTPIDPEETAGALESRLAVLGAPLVAASIRALLDGSATILPQDPDKVSKAPKLNRESGRIVWNLPAHAIHNLVRAMRPWPVARTLWQPDDPARQPIEIQIHEARVTAGAGEPGTVLESVRGELVIAAGEAALRVLVLQVPGKKAMPAADFLRGHPLRAGSKLT